MVDDAIESQNSRVRANEDKQLGAHPMIKGTPTTILGMGAILTKVGPFSVNPNPPKDTDGRREGSGRGWVRELQGRWPGVLG